MTMSPVDFIDELGEAEEVFDTIMRAAISKHEERGWRS